MTRTESVKSVNGSSRSNSPPPKKRNSKDKKENTDNTFSSAASMEHSGGTNERKGDQKVDSCNQCDIGDTAEINELKITLARTKEEVTELIKEKGQLKAHNARKHAGYEAEINEIIIEKDRYKVQLIKLQSEKDLLQAKVTSMQNDNDANEVDECIEDIVSEGNCEHVGCGMAQLQRLNVMKNQVGRWNSPAENVTNSKLFYCPQCNWASRPQPGSSWVHHEELPHPQAAREAVSVQDKPPVQSVKSNIHHHSLKENREESVNKSKRKIIRRKAKYSKIVNLKLFGNNVDGISNKLESLEHLILTEDPSNIFLQETKLGRSGRTKLQAVKTLHGMNTTELYMQKRELRGVG